MSQSTLPKYQSPFCNNAFKKLGNHLAHCPDRSGRDYNHLLSQKTLDIKSGKGTCPKCGRKFSRLDTHLKNSAICKDTQTDSPAPSTDPDPIPAVIPPSPSHPSQQPQPPQYPQPAPPPPVTISPRMKLPQTAVGWSEANEYMRQVVVPRVLHDLDVNVMNHALCVGMYSYFTSKYGMQELNQHHQHRQHLSKVQKLRNELKKALTEKNAAKKKLRPLRKAGSDPETVKQLACEFHSLVRAHSHLSKAAKGLERRESQKQQRKECRKDLYKFAKKMLNDEAYTSTEPTFTAAEAEVYFNQVYSTSPATFTRPLWMLEPPSPSTGLDGSAFTEEELSLIISRLNSSSCPSPMDQIPYLVLKKCPSLTPALLPVFNSCWSVKRIPAAWKVGVLRFIGKKQAVEDPSNPKNFRPIALTSCIGKVFTSLLKQLWMAYMRTNNYLNTAVQKAFVDGVPACTEYHIKLLSMLSKARRKHRSLCVCWLDLANAFGSVHHNLIRFSFQHYLAPPEIVDMVSSLYEDLIGVVFTKS